MYNVSGNVWEWCADWWSTTFRQYIDPTGPSEGTARVMRGGSYLCHDSYCNRYRVAARTSNTPKAQQATSASAAHRMQTGQPPLRSRRWSVGAGVEQVGDGPVHSHFFGQSSLATHAVARARKLVPLPNDVPFEVAAPNAVRAAGSYRDWIPGSAPRTSNDY